MHSPGQHEDEGETTLLSTPDGEREESALDEAEHTDGVVEFNQRRAKMERLRAEGIEPYPHGSWLKDRTLIKDVLAAHDPSELEAGEHTELRYQLAGRLISRRGHGKTSFLDLRDLSGSMQIHVRLDKLRRGAYERILNL